jgi:hypothetical protein
LLTGLVKGLQEFERVLEEGKDVTLSVVKGKDVMTPTVVTLSRELAFCTKDPNGSNAK